MQHHTDSQSHVSCHVYLSVYSLTYESLHMCRVYCCLSKGTLVTWHQMIHHQFTVIKYISLS